MTLNKHILKELVVGDILYHRWATNADGTPERWVVNGKVKLWKTRPDDFKIPVKRGLYEYSYITEAEVDCFYVKESDVYRLKAETALRKVSYERKPASWGEVKKAVSWKYNKKHIKNLIHYFPRDVYLNCYPSPADLFNYQPDTMVFVLELANGKKFLINTEGFDYCRYVTQIL